MLMASSHTGINGKSPSARALRATAKVRPALSSPVYKFETVLVHLGTSTACIEDEITAVPLMHCHCEAPSR